MQEGMIIGVVGTICSGKSLFAEMLISKGFHRLGFSDEVREECKARGLEIERKILQDIGNEMREKNGGDYWAKRIISKMKPGRNYVVEGIRNPGEVEALKELDNFILIGVDAPVEERLQWIIKRNKDSDPKTIDEIKKIDERDRGKGEKQSGQQVDACFKMADLIIMNHGTLNELKDKVDKLSKALR
jgi:dephospho-CoA kinase